MSGQTHRVLTITCFLVAAHLFSSCKAGEAPGTIPATAPALLLQPASPPPTVHPTGVRSALDMREANILAVTFALLADGEYRFDVTLLHDDEGEAPSFADRWVVEDLEGNLLGERILLHAHSSEPFTRSATISIPAGIYVVIVRGHDALHGYGGQAMRLDLRDGSTEPLLDHEGQ